MHNTQGHNCPDTTTGEALDNHVAEGVGVYSGEFIQIWGSV